jgi:hypothetical protein
MFNHTDSLYYRPKADRVAVSSPKQPYVAAIGQLLAAYPGAEVDYDYYGYARTFSAPAGQSFAGHAFGSDVVAHAKKLLAKGGLFYKALGLNLKNIQLHYKPEAFELPDGRKRVMFSQVLKVQKGKRTRNLPVRGGYIQVWMDAQGRVYQVTSTLRHGRKPRSMKRLLNREQAVKIALGKHGTKSCDTKVCARLTLSAHNGWLDPVWEIELASKAPGPKVWQYLVKATTRELVFGVNKLYYAASVEVKARALLRIPKPTEVAADMRDTVLKDLPDPKYLRNERFDMLVEKNGKWSTVEALPDGTFNFPWDSAEAEAVTCFIAMNDEDTFAELCSGHKAKKIPVYVRDKSAGSDNAYFDPSGWEIHILPGTGLDAGGLYIYIGLDTGVSEHENYHKRVAVETPEGDLPGSEGAGTHEGVGDYGDILSEYRRMFLYGDKYGTPLTRAFIKADPRIIGFLAMYPDGIRKQRNKKTVADKNGEPHNDGEIVGGAMCDVMEVLLTDESISLEQGLKNACAVMNVALQHVPTHKVLFRDMLRAFITADQLLFGSKYRKAIEKCFGDHGIKLSGKLDDPDAAVRRIFAA